MSAAKELENRRTLPDPEDQAQPGDLLFDFWLGSYRKRGPKLHAKGINQRGDLKLNFGDRLGEFDRGTVLWMIVTDVLSHLVRVSITCTDSTWCAVATRCYTHSV